MARIKLERDKIKAKIKASNEEFMRLSKEEKRIWIINDCLDRIEAGNLVPSRGCLMNSIKVTGNNSVTTFIESWKPENASKSVKDLINMGDSSCETCAKGALFLSYIGRVNNFTLGEVTPDNDPSSAHEISSTEMVKLSEIFSLDQLDLIEAVFEGVISSSVWCEEKRKEKLYLSVNNKQNYSQDMLGDIYTYHRVFNDEMDILENVLHNMLRNNGEFVVTDLEDVNA